MITKKDVLTSAENFIELGTIFVKQYLRENGNFIDLENGFVNYYNIIVPTSLKLYTQKLYFLRLINDDIMLFDYLIFTSKFKDKCIGVHWREYIEQSKMDNDCYFSLSSGNYSVLPTLHSIIMYMMQNK